MVMNFSSRSHAVTQYRITIVATSNFAISRLIYHLNYNDNIAKLLKKTTKKQHMRKVLIANQLYEPGFNGALLSWTIQTCGKGTKLKYKYV